MKAYEFQMTDETAARAIPEIVARLMPIDPARIILFGSRASGAAGEDSDLDLIVVTSSDAMPATHQEKEDAYLEVARLLRDIRREVPVDLIVHTRPMHAKFVELDSLFAREVLQKGIVVYESHHA
jgi:predicted nucleotidyltransferase